MANSYLQRTTGTPASQTKFTVSVWAKRSGLNPSGNNMDMFCIYSDGSNRMHLRFQEDDIDVINYGGSTQARLTTDRKFRDTNAWYHIVYRVDTTLATADDRLRLYINGVQETSFSVRTNPSQNFNFGTNWSTTRIGLDNSSSYFDGYISHIAYADGQSLAPTVFGETDSTSGIWKIITAPSVTWGTNGFHLKFENSANLGLDSSGQGNNFTVNGNLKQGLTNPSNIYQSLNPNSTDSGVTLTNGATTADFDGSVGNAKGQLAVTKGKWYYECKITASSNYPMLGIGEINRNQMEKRTGGSYPGGFQDSYGVYGNGNVYANGSNTGSQGFTYATNDIISIIIDLDSGTKTIKYNKNGTQIATTNITNAGDDFAYAPMDYNGGESGVTCNYNFGEGRFGTTDITSAGSNGNGSLFEYDVPSGHYAMNTKNINTYG